METDAESKPRPSTSTPVSQNSPGAVLEKMSSLPSQPEFYHDVLVATQSLTAVSSNTGSISVAPQDTKRKSVTPSLRDQNPTLPVESSPSTVNKESRTVASEQPEDDSQAAQKEGLGEVLGIDASHSVMSRCSQSSKHNNVTSSTKTAVEPKAAPSSLKHSGEGVRTEDRALSKVQESMQKARNVTNVSVSYASGGSPMNSPADKVEGARLKSDMIDALDSSCVQQTPPTATDDSLASMSQSVFSQISNGDSVIVTGSESNAQLLLKRGQCSAVPSQLLSLDQDIDEEGEPGEEEKGIVKERENTFGREGSALGLALSQSQMLPMEMARREEGSSLIVRSESERSHVPLEKEDPLSSSQQNKSGSQPPGSKVSTNDHGSQSQHKDVCVAPDSLSQADREGPEAKGVKDKSISVSSGERHKETGQMTSKKDSTLSEEQRELDLGRRLLGDARMRPVVKLTRIDFLLVKEEPPQIKDEQDDLFKRPNDGFSYLFSSSTQEVEEQQRRQVMAIFDEKSDEEEFLGFPDPDHDSKPSKQTHSVGRQTAKKTFICTECGKSFRDKGHLNMHTIMHTGKWPHTCKICGYGSTRKCDLILHMRTHTGLKPFTCTVCYKAHRQIAHLKSHMRTHTGERPVTCTICGKGCAHNSQLKSHMRIHTGEKPFICITCGRGFNDVGHLKTHWRVHTGEKPFTCKVCGISCSQKINLKRHMMTHTGESRPRPFVCTFCGKGFESTSTLKLHTMVHTDERPFKCNVCGKGCREMNHMRTHMRTHTGEKPFICTVCGKACSQSSHLRVHMQGVHKVNVKGCIMKFDLKTAL